MKTMKTKKSNKEGGVRKMKKILVIFAAVVVLSLGSAYAMPIMMDPGQISGFSNTNGGDTLTGVFNELGLYVQTTSTITGPTTFSDVGDVNVSHLIAPTSVDTENLGSDWELTGGWTNLAGTIAHYIGYDEYTYTGGILNLYADTGSNHDFGLSIGSDDDNSFYDGTLVATAVLTSGTGHLWYAGGVPIYGSTLTNWKFTSMLSNFWLDQYGNDLSPYVSSIPGFYVASEVDANTNNIEVNLPYNIYSDHDGSASIDIVPEPATLLLLGSGILGLLGMVGIRRKKA